MGMDHDMGGMKLEFESVRFGNQQVLDELFEEETATGYALGQGLAQFAIILGEHGKAGGLEKQDGGVVRVPNEHPKIVLAQPACLAQVALAERRPAAAFASGGQADLKSGGFQHLDRRNPDVRFVVANEGVVPEYDPAPSGGTFRPMSGKPLVEA